MENTDQGGIGSCMYKFCYNDVGEEVPMLLRCISFGCVFLRIRSRRKQSDGSLQNPRNGVQGFNVSWRAMRPRLALAQGAAAVDDKG
jgi:hypothetical protein